MSKQALELFVFDLLGDLLNLRMNPGSGNKRGDGDLTPKILHNNAVLNFGFECKDKNVEAHTVSNQEWQKAKTQISRRNLEPVFVTRNSTGEILVHLDAYLFKNILEEIVNKK